MLERGRGFPLARLRSFSHRVGNARAISPMDDGSDEPYFPGEPHKLAEPGDRQFHLVLLHAGSWAVRAAPAQHCPSTSHVGAGFPECASALLLPEGLENSLANTPMETPDGLHILAEPQTGLAFNPVMAPGWT